MLRRWKKYSNPQLKIGGILVTRYVPNTIVSREINPDWEKSSYQAMEDVMNYAADDLKTEQKFYVSGINCVPERANGGSSERTLEGMKSHEADTLSAV